MANKQDYLAGLQVTVSQLHNCGAVWRESVPVGADNKTERFVTVLEIPPVDSPQTAVKMAIYSDLKKGEK